MRQFGEIEGWEAGTEFSSRAELSASGIHRPTQAGISGSETEGADSIVVSGGYEDDEDYGDYLIYGGQAGFDPNTKLQNEDAELSRGNLALVVSYNVAGALTQHDTGRGRALAAVLRGAFDYLRGRASGPAPPDLSSPR